MKKVFLILVLTLLSTSPAFAQFTRDSYVPPREAYDYKGSGGLLPRHNFALGSEIYYVKYEEPSLMQNEGAMYGVVADYAYHNKIMLKLEGRTAWGSVDYSSTSTGSSDDNDDFVFEGRSLAGYDLIFDRFRVTPFLGFGYRYLNDDSQGSITTTGHAGYERESNYFYSPVGLEVMYHTEEGWSFGAGAEFDIFWYGLQKSHLSGAVAGLNDVENEQNKGYGFRASVKVQKQGERFGVRVEPFIRWWSIEDSKTSTITYNGVAVGYGLEPKNKTLELGAQVALLF